MLAITDDNTTADPDPGSFETASVWQYEHLQIAIYAVTSSTAYVMATDFRGGLHARESILWHP
jgi:siroheme synthase (precorrin-2 oxidase/ferrochelatase)